jgi:hypothetical protein
VPDFCLSRFLDCEGAKVLIAVDGMRLCLICEEIFTMQGAAVHATTQCYPRTKESEPDEGTLDPCSPSLPLIESSSSPGRA